MNPQASSIEVKLNNHGRYTWSIKVLFENSYDDAVKMARAIDDELRSQFPDHALRGSGRIASIEDGE